MENVTYRFDLRLRNVTIASEERSFSHPECVIDHAIEIAVRAAIPNLKVWVIDSSGVVMILGARAACIMKQQRKPRSSGLEHEHWGELVL